MSVIDILTRVDVLCKKYEKYDLDKQRAADSVSGHDQFLKLYTLVEADIEASLQVFVCVCMCGAIICSIILPRTEHRGLELGIPQCSGENGPGMAVFL